jgi:hypothetical protein
MAIDTTTKGANPITAPAEVRAISPPRDADSQEARRGELVRFRREPR